MIYVTHSLTEVLTLADWVLMIKQGHLITQGIPKQALRSSHAILQIPEEQFENVFTVAFVESDPESGRTKVSLQTGEELIIPYMQTTGRIIFPDPHQCRRHYRGDPES